MKHASNTTSHDELERSGRHRRRFLNLRDYFETAIGNGYLATAGLDGSVNLALYDRPVVVDDDVVAFAMKSRLTYDNLQDNPHAAYAFHEPGPRRGVRLYLLMERQESGGDLLERIQQRAQWLSGPEEAKQLRHLVYFRVVDHQPLVNG